MLEYIAAKCMSMDLKDFAMFSCVCCSWHEAATVVKSTQVLQQQMPWLVLSNDDGDKRNLLDLSNNKCYNLCLPETCNRNCYGTGSEWILTVGLDREIHLFNPLTRALLPLPSYQTFLHQPGGSSDQDEDDIDEDQIAANKEYMHNNSHHFIMPESPYDDNELFRRYYISRAYVLPPPHEEKESSKLLVVVIYGVGDFVAVATPEDSEWTPIIDATVVRDVAYCPTLGLTLFVQGSGFVSYCDLHQLYNKNSTSIPLRLVDYAAPSKYMSEFDNPKQCMFAFEKFYLLESFGDILMVQRTYDEKITKTFAFEVYKLDLKTKEWKEVLDLGDVVLFVGNSPATSVNKAASSFPSSCNRNSIYFNDDGREGCPWGPKYNELGKLIDFVPGGRDMGAYDFANGTVEPFYHGHDYLSEYSLPIWLMPKL